MVNDSKQLNDIVEKLRQISLRKI